MALVAADVSTELSELHGEDGRFLRFFVERNWHKKPEARSLAVDKWLIRGEFYDKHLEDFCNRYEQREDQLVKEVDDAEQWIIDLKGMGRSKNKVDQLEQHLKEAKGDVFQLRDTLVAAVRQMTPPRRTLGLSVANMPMTDEAKEHLKRKEQVRTRDIVMVCLREILDSGIGGEVLQVCADAVHKSIERFEARHRDLGDVSEAMAGRQWRALKDMLAEIDSKIEADTGLPSKRSLKNAGPGTAPEGRGTRQILERCLKELGGEARVQEIFTWIEENPQALEDLAESDARLNRKNSQSKKSKAAAKKGQALPIWKETVKGALNKPPFQKKERGLYRLASVLGQDSAPSRPATSEADRATMDAKRSRISMEMSEAAPQEVRLENSTLPTLTAEPIKDAFEADLEAALGL
jgi:hypothetical protein